MALCSLFGAFLVIFGLGAVSCQRCTRPDIDDCIYSNTHKNGCMNHGYIVSCVENLKGDCDDVNKEIAINTIVLHENKIDACKGLEDGRCFDFYLNDNGGQCLDAITFTSLSDPGQTLNANECKVLKHHMAGSTACLNFVMDACQGKKEQDKVQEKLDNIRQLAKLCKLKTD